MKQADTCSVFTGAGVSVESGIPPFRGEAGLWSQYDPKVLDIGHFHRDPEEAWQAIRTIFYDFFGKAKANAAHRAIGSWEQRGLVSGVITQNIDNLHQEGGSTVVHEFHGNSHTLCCVGCGSKKHYTAVNLTLLPPKCECGEVMKPDFVFFGEGIPMDAYEKSLELSRRSDVMIVIGTTGEVMPACNLPHEAKRYGAYIVEINPEPSSFTHTITDAYFPMPASEVCLALDEFLQL